MNYRIKSIFGLLALLGSCSALAAVSTEEAKQLGTTLTPWGAEKAGNKDGTIPAYSGERIKIPANYDPKKPGVRPDPFAQEKPLFSVTAANVGQYADKVSPGFQELFKKYPTFRMDVYPTHRTALYPKYVQDNSIKNATSCKIVGENETIEGCYGGIPFPIPKNGIEVIWNKAWKFSQTGARSGESLNYLIDPTGRPMLQGSFEPTSYYEPMFDPTRTTPFPKEMDFHQWRGDLTGPARSAGEKMVNTYPMMMNKISTKFWQYLPGQRRVKLGPDVAYDTPSPTGGGASLMDEVQVYTGAMDRYDFKLVGKREMFIPYNTFKANSVAPGNCSIEKLYMKNHLNPDCERWELHRVWVVAATLKPGKRHVYPKRNFYFDEDNAGAGMGEQYDAAGKIYRVVAVDSIPLYEEEAAFNSDMYYVYDLQTGAYNPFANLNTGWYVIPPPPKNYYTPEAIGAAGIR